ncbi:hypothetical protein [Catellatospora chokoriensis]|uniref:hypothetical protein n=1 Tax=Catellatospora chokoriensis TaxID=310353 RepID=UPI001EF31FF0|nr:hypothetical protein [Catellatospora chokoriensis]
MKHAILTIGRTVLRGTLPYPDVLRRVRVRRSARDLAARDPWPQDDTAVTGLDFAQLALLRVLSLQQETRRAVRSRQREAAALLARVSIETCIVGLWCLHNPDAVSKLRAAEIKTMPAMLAFLSSAGLIPDTLIRQAVRTLGEPEKLLDVRSMAAQIDAATSGSLAVALYDGVYRHASHYFTHATSSSLLRHVTSGHRRTVRPVKSWARRAPVRLADACVGLLAGAIAERVSAPAALFVRYAEGHAWRVLPPMLFTMGKGVARRISIADALQIVKRAQEVRAYLASAGPGEASQDRETHLRDLYEELILRLDLDAPREAIQPIIDHFVVMVLAEWDTDFANRASPALVAPANET